MERQYQPISYIDPPEEWRAIPGFPDYEASSLGRVRRITAAKFTPDPPRLISQRLNRRHRYFHVILFRDRKRYGATVHSLVAAAFHGPCPDGHEVDHVDGNRQNNRPTNLEYVTHQENCLRGGRRTVLRNSERLLSKTLREYERGSLDGWKNADEPMDMGPVHWSQS